MIFLHKFASRSLYSPFRDVMNNSYEINEIKKKRFFFLSQSVNILYSPKYYVYIVNIISIFIYSVTLLQCDAVYKCAHLRVFLFRCKQQLRALQDVQQFGTCLAEFRSTLQSDKESLALLDVALQAGATPRIASSVSHFARLLSERQDANCQVLCLQLKIFISFDP